MAGFGLQFKKQKDRKSPKWLGSLLKKKFFRVCEDHRNVRKSEMNIYCIDCDLCMCSHCLVSPARSSGGHRSHKILQIRRYIYQDVIRILDMQSLLDCSGVQPYTVNNAKVVLLRRRKQSKPSRASTSCEMCGRAITDPNRYCSIACKVSKGPAKMTRSSPSISSLDGDHEADEEVSCCVSSVEPQPSDSSEVAMRRKINDRKGIPRRAPLF
ncbi:PLATZ transcription factor protein [Dioscorea alata]|uniref:PLATZ transcription factor protein n=1 Tax=Dioscorea alata TaxID=55571 RepID=A0ACB7W8T3_DIOAL|nr:PLATZ transcription factor protein [Dioscorea alata]